MSSENIESFKSNIFYIHFCLSSLTYYNKNMHAAEETAIEDCDFLGLIKGEWGFNILSSKTLEKLKEFRRRWLAYKQENSYAEDLTFTSIDKNWHALINNFLIPALDALEEEISGWQIEFVSYKIFHEISIRPSDGDILERVKILYGLLHKHKIVELKYVRE